ncbi:MAG: hypothetical protein ABS955_14645, partial [Stenotrophomonas maltophilia]
MNVQPVQDLPEFATWLNASPTTLAELQGRPVVLAFVNAASVWCAQRLAELAQWQLRNPGKLQLLVLQVPRFDGERDPGQSLKLLRRQGLNAPALLDAEWDGWRRFGVTAWPTLVLLDAQGRERERLVGLGGELDATNVIDTPEVAVITAIGLDHTAMLGDTLPQIASAKAGII